jgi:hypothetical protein
MFADLQKEPKTQKNVQLKRKKESREIQMDLDGVDS